MHPSSLSSYLYSFYGTRTLSLLEKDFFNKLFKDDHLDEVDTGSFNQAQFWNYVYQTKTVAESGNMDYKRLQSLLLDLYRYLITHVNKHLFENAGTINQAMIMNNNCITHINGGYKFLPLSVNTFDMVKHETKAILLIDNQKYLVVDFSEVAFPQLLPLLWSFILSKKTEGAKSQTYSVIPVLTMLMAYKMTTKTSIETISEDDISCMRNFIIRGKDSECHKYLVLRNLYGVIMNAHESRLLIAHKAELETLTLTYERVTAPNKQLPDGVRRKVISIVRDNKDNDEISHILYVITFLLTYTSFRMESIFRLKSDCLKFELGKYFILIETKQSNGKRVKEYITDQTAKLIQDQLERNQIYRNKFERTGYQSENLFSCASPSDPGTIITFNNYYYNAYLKKELEANGLKAKVMGSKLRTTYNTDVIGFKDKKNLSGMELSYLTRHAKDEIVYKNYLDDNESLRRMLMETYNIIIKGRVEIKGKVQNAITPDKKSIVSNKCGACTASDCPMKSAFLCIVCENFVTTPAHKPRIIKQIGLLDNQIANAPSSHDREDLLTIKEAYVLTLEEIIKFEDAKEKNDGTKN